MVSFSAVSGSGNTLSDISSHFKRKIVSWETVCVLSEVLAFSYGDGSYKIIRQ